MQAKFDDDRINTVAPNSVVKPEGGGGKAPSRRLMLNATPSVWKLRFDIRSALAGFETLDHRPEVLLSHVKAKLRELLAYLSKFEDTNRLLVREVSRVDDDGFELPFEPYASNVGDGKGDKIALGRGGNGPE